MKPLYRLYDIYDELLNGERTKIGEYLTLKEVAKACNEYAKECDDECEFALYQLDNTINQYKLLRNWHYTKNTIVIN